MAKIKEEVKDEVMDEKVLVKSVEKSNSGEDKQREKQSIKRKIINVLSIIVSILAIPIIVINGMLIVKSFIYPDDVPDAFGYKPFIILSGSMEPTLLVGDLEIVKEVDPSTLKVDDIVAYRIDNAVVTHRITEIKEYSGQAAFITKGDNNGVADSEPVSYDQIEGIYVTHITGLGNVAMFLQSVPGILLVIVLPMGLILVFNTITKMKQSKQLKEELDEVKKKLEDK